MARRKIPSAPRRTRAHIIASQSYNYVEKFFIDKGHTVDRPSSDYGTDMLVNTFDEEGYAENGDIRIQLKASDRLNYSDDGSYIPFAIETRHYHTWIKEPMPVFLVLYDAQATAAYWLYVQAYAASTARTPRRNAKSITLRIPVANRFTSDTVDYMRARKAAVLEAEIQHDH